MAFHHKPSALEGDKVLSAIVHLADYMTQVLKIGDFVWDKDYTFDPEVISILDLGDENYLNNFIESYRELFYSQVQTLNF